MIGCLQQSGFLLFQNEKKLGILPHRVFMCHKVLKISSDYFLELNLQVAVKIHMDYTYFFLIFNFSPCIWLYVQFTHQKMQNLFLKNTLKFTLKYT